MLSLLNATVANLGRHIDATMTAAYIDIYGTSSVSDKGPGEPGGDGTAGGGAGGGGGSSKAPSIELVTEVSPMTSPEEVVSLFASGLADFAAAAPPALHAIGLSQVEIEAALERHETKEAETEQIEKEDRAMMLDTQKVALDSQKASLSAIKSGNKVAQPSAPSRVGGGRGDD